MVQKCINEDFLRYQRTLLVLTVDKGVRGEDAGTGYGSGKDGVNGVAQISEEEMFKQITKKAEIRAKLNAVKQAIIEVLAEHKSGVSLP